MNHLVRRSQVGSWLRLLPCRFSVFRFPKTLSLPLGELKGEEDLLRKQEAERTRAKVRRKYLRQRTKLLKLKSIHRRKKDGENIESQIQGLPIHKMLASYISVFDVKGMEEYLNKLEKEGPKGYALDMLRKSEPLLFTTYEYCDILEPKVYCFLMIMYRKIGEKEDLRRLWNLAKDKKMVDMEEYVYTIRQFWLKDDIEGAHHVFENWDTGEHSYFEVEMKNILKFGYYRKLVMQDTEWMVDDMLEDHKDEEEKKKTAMEVRRNGWDPKKNLALSAYACFQFVEGQRNIESAVDVLRLLGKREPQDTIRDRDRLSRKLVEAMRGGGYVGGV